MKKKTFIHLAALAAVLVLASAALAKSKYKPVESAKDVQGGGTLIVGKIVIDPPLLKGEQDLRKFVGDIGRASARHLARYKDKAFIVLDENGKYELKGEYDVYGRETIIPLGNTFVVSTPERKSVYNLASGIVMSGGESTRDRAYLPAGYKIPVRKSDKAVYIGTIVYYRDEFMRVKKVRVKDEYNSAKEDLRKLMGKNVKMKKALIRVK